MSSEKSKNKRLNDKKLQISEEKDSLSIRMAKIREKHFAGWGGKTKIAEALNLNLRQYARYEDERTPPPTVLTRAAEICKINLEWLLTGEGEMEKNAEPERVILSKIPVRGYKEEPRGVVVPAGVSATATTLLELDNTRGFVGKSLFAIIYTGVSMAPVVMEGSIVVINPDEDARPMQIVAYKLKSESFVHCKMYLGEWQGDHYFLSCAPVEPQFKVPHERLDWLFPTIGVVNP